MPVYEYICKACEHEFEREQRISDDPVKKCPECGALKAKRLISRTSFVLKGGGWYSDLYSSASGKKSGGDESGAAAGGESGSESSKKSDDSKKAPAPGKSGSTGEGKSGGKKGGGKGSKAAA